MLTLLFILVACLAFWLGCLFTEYRSCRKTARYIDQFNKAARPNTRKGI